MNFLNYLIQLDKALFLKINTQWTNSFLDSVSPWFREANTWIPLYLFLFLFAVMNFSWRIWPWIVVFIISVTLTDQVSSTFIKAWINRPRPCSDPQFSYQVHLLLSYCPGNGSFTSSHATNHFGAAFYIFFTMKPYFKKWGYLFFLWAAIISYAQVYVGIHYPLDVIGGALLGSGIGFFTSRMFNKYIGLPPLIDQQKVFTP